tara:strand:- start:220 stop:621 length:402 start_codon:yes stop_codon:yes gene_type:complete
MSALKKFLNDNKKAVGVVVVIAILFVVYINFFSEPQDDALLSGEDQTMVNSEIGREIVNTLNQLKVLEIDPEFFDDPVFQELTDFTVEVQERPVGKANPFAPGNNPNIAEGQDSDVTEQNQDIDSETDAEIAP